MKILVGSLFGFIIFIIFMVLVAEIFCYIDKTK